jgi:hypothetical protein
VAARARSSMALLRLAGPLLLAAGSLLAASAVEDPAQGDVYPQRLHVGIDLGSEFAKVRL